ncbi:nitrite reductase small subunit NirD [Paenibacillus sp. HJL G12]|uniref:Nitrite reductase small subunit NirD n=1 Tax=Paenibacillus dendrobii TaxID=2691084 RepID=A0A7X3LIY7_9BACL|nr:nitrite reductase small subunit NirD [Paenibacillus dendrobii]MWV45083.1 nitrite reductase small subunit NirD [Paenibacillus dendrobii]
MNDTLNYFPAGKLEDYTAQMGRVVHIQGLEIAVFCTSSGELYALDNRSPHPKGGPLAEGMVSGHFVYDPLYDWKIDLRDGLVQAPDHGEVRTHQIRVQEGTVSITLSKSPEHSCDGKCTCGHH